MFRFFIVFFFLAQGALAVNSIEQDFTCPFDGNRWKQRMETSAEVKGVRLDLRQLGDVVQPPTLPQCPKCRAVLFMDNSSPEIVAALKPLVATEDYAQLASKYPSYYLLAQMQEYLRPPHDKPEQLVARLYYVGHSYLRASWQLENKPRAAKQCIDRAHEWFATALAEMGDSGKYFANTNLLLVELERRQGRFEVAGKRARALKNADAFKEAGHQRIIARQMELIAKRDSEPHAIYAAHDSLAAAPVPSVRDAKPAPAHATPLPRVDVMSPHSLESVSELAKPKPKPSKRNLSPQ